MERRWGWDCHGLPVENEVEKELGLKTKKDIEDFGVDKFCEACRSIVLRYVNEWEKTVDRMGRWVDFKNDYKTMDPSYMESIWWAFKSLWDKGLVYEGYKPMHICPRCETPLSNFEVTQGYKDVTDLSLTAKFELVDEPGTYILAWTTTPWTLAGNVALAVGADIDYVKVKAGKDSFILAKAMYKHWEKQKKVEEGTEQAAIMESKEVEKLKGKDLVGKKYKPLFDFYEDVDLENKENIYTVYDADFISTEEGTGVVHIAPAFGEDDMNLGREKKLPFIQHVKLNGTFTDEITPWAGKDCKKTDPKIVDYLEEQGLLFSKEKYKHSYPHCWRCETPLLNYGMSSWFVNVQEIKDRMLKVNQGINWVPAHLRDGRFGKWLEGARDWAISRNRYWGTPLPIWRCECEEMKCLGSMQDLKENIPGRFTKIIFVRHGESEGNLAGVRQSKVPGTPLTKRGKEQAKKCAEILKNEKIDLIFASPLQRAQETAGFIAKEHGLEIQTEERVKEINFGEHEGKTDEELEEYLMHRYSLPYEERHNHKAGGRESHADVAERVTKFVEELLEKYPGKTIVIASHSDPIRFWETKAKNHTLERAYALGHAPYATPQVHYLDNQTKELVDLHKHFMDKIELDCSCGKKMKRIPEVLDCWFESGSMPYAQAHYPFENKEWFERRFPADFIAEGLDQTRGWFYTLIVLSTALFDKPAFKNVIVNGIVLAEDGSKMSKRKKNYPDPLEVFDRYGADAVRFYMMNSSVVKADDVRFNEKEVANVVRNVFLPFWNAYCFFVTYANIDKWQPKKEKSFKPKHDLDRWILSELNTLIENVTEQMDKYDLQRATDPLVRFLDDLTNWYIRRSRRRFWKSENDVDKKEAYQTLHIVLETFAQLMAPFAPFIMEEVYQSLTNE